MWRCESSRFAVQSTSHHLPSQRALCGHPHCHVLTWYARKRPGAAIKPVHVAERKTTILQHKGRGFYLGQQKAPPSAGQDSEPSVSSEVGSEQQTGAAGYLTYGRMRLLECITMQVRNCCFGRAGAAGSKSQPTENVLLPDDVNGLNDFAVPTTNDSAKARTSSHHCLPLQCRRHLDLKKGS